MYPENYNYKPDRSNQPHINKRPLFIIGGVLLAILLALVVGTLLSGRSSSGDDANIADPGYAMTETGLNLDVNRGAIYNNELYAYNGLNFFKQSLDGRNKLTTLGPSVKLPRISKLTWAGSAGAVMKFNGLYVGTQASDLLRAQNITTSTINDDSYRWFVNFSTGALTLLSRNAPDVDPVYAERSNTLYYIGPRVVSPAVRTPLAAYNIATGSSSEVVGNINIGRIDSISLCRNGSAICIIGGDTTNTKTKLYALDLSSRQVSTLHELTGQIKASNDPDRFLLITAARNDDPAYADAIEDPDAENDTELAPGAASVFNINDNSNRDLRFDAEVGTTFPLFNTDGSFVMFDSSYNASQPRTNSTADFKPAYRAGVNAQTGEASSKLFPLNLPNGEGLRTPIIAVSAGKDGPVLLTRADGAQYIFSTSDTPLTAAKQSNKQADAVVKGCLAAAGTGAESELPDTSSEFSIYLTFDDGFNQRTNDFGRCVATKGSAALVGFSYKIFGKDPESGRLVTD